MPNVEKLAIYENIERYGHKFSLSLSFIFINSQGQGGKIRVIPSLLKGIPSLLVYA